MSIIRKRLVFTGSVQGVGFRWRAYHAATLYSVTGFVRNLYDGSVEMEAEGAEESIDRVVQALNENPYAQIDDISVKALPVQNSRTFEIED